jgi:hypothetical protein
MKKYIYLIIILLVLILIAFFFFSKQQQPMTDLIRVTTPVPNQVVTSPLIVRGEARGTWFFEASFPVTLLDGNGNVVVQHYAMTASDWMTNDFVPFESTLVFQTPQTPTGVLVLAKDNPSGLPKHDAEIRIPVRFGQNVPQLSACQVTGCSGQICSDKEVVTTCEYREEYACYQRAVCERQPTGECGWTPSVELTMCLGADGKG